MIFSSNFKQFSRVTLLAAALLLIQPKQTSAAEPTTIVVIATWIATHVGVPLLIFATEETLRYILTPSKDEKDYKSRHEVLKKKNKVFFTKMIETIKKETDFENAELKILSNHELYRYQNFIEAIKESCPNYTEYIKQLYTELVNNYKKRKVRGFKRVYKANIISRELPGHNAADDYFEFYELIKTLYQEILIAEQLKELTALILNKNASAINESWEVIDKKMLYLLLSTIGCQEKNDAAYYVALSLITTYNKESAELHYIAATILLSLPNTTIAVYEKALEHLRKAFELNPDDTTIVNELALAESLYKQLTNQIESTTENK